MSADLLLCSTSASTASLIDVRSGGMLHTLKDCRPTTHGLCATQGFVITAEQSRSFLHVWSWRKEQPRFRCQAPERITCLTCTADGAHAVGGGVSGKLYLWQISTGRLLLAWDAHFKSLKALACAMADGFLISAADDAILNAWSFASLLHAAHTRRADPPTTFRTWTEHTLPIAALCVSPCGQHDLIASASADQTVRVWRLADSVRSSVHTADLPAALTTVAAHPRLSCLYVGGADGNLYVVPLLVESVAAVDARAAARRSSTPHAGALRALAVSTDGGRVFSCGVEPGLRVWDALSLALLQVLHPKVVFECLSPLARRPDELSFGGSLVEEAVANGTTSGAGGTAAAASALLAPLKKFVETAPDEVAGGASAMGCVPCALAVDASAAWTDEDELPLMATLPDLGTSGSLWGNADAPSFAVGGLGESSRVMAAEAQIRQLRTQLAQLHEVNRELYSMAADATLGVV